ncbi:MAG: hypothetical protein DHS20C14_04730 [Phycisphaeraceae bacterium]|nr:MAG: hypothetical protein DHS20C14_04730 [Phycisphaeraceae bacterium]
MNESQTTPPHQRAPSGRFVARAGRRLYEIQHVDEMPPFLMTVVGDSDLWLYLSSSGALTAGRVEPERCLFPYETDDRLHAAGGLTGPVTLVRFADGSLWRPLDPRPLTPGRTRRLLRTPIGDAVILEETDAASGLTFRSEWSLSDAHGIVRRCELELDEGADAIEIDLLDGLVNLMPANVPLGTQQTSSTLVDAYKRSELDDETSLAIYALEAAISDRPEASESLRANIVWRAGLEGATVCLSDRAVRDFKHGRTPRSEHLNTGRRGAYLCCARVSLQPGTSERWAIAGDVYLDHAAIVWRRRWLASRVDRLEAIERDLAEGLERLETLLDQADGAQMSADASVCAAHRSNVLFNAMRGGVPPEGYSVDAADFRRFLHTRHRPIAGRHDGFVARLGDQLSIEELVSAAEDTGDPQLVRLAMEYLPLTFGRRHGDPSRPWNRFRIRMRHADGSRALGYEGNWRDIFQNWEALCRSYPALLPGIIAKFVNASTLDGHNPYRISEGGIDWEVPDPEDPWSNIGYWGDHQLVYLLRLIEQLRDTDPETLERMLESRVFSYADVPYRIRPFDALVRDPSASIHFDAAHDALVRARSEEIGSDGRLVLDETGEPHLVTLVEKLLVTALAKVSNLVPGGGIWMNTQRPEWNDANNALAGHGLSMVTLYQLRRFADFGVGLLAGIEDGETPISDAIGEWCDSALAALVRWLEVVDVDPDLSDDVRWNILRDLGRAAGITRQRLAERGLGGAGAYPTRAITDMLRLTRHACDHAIQRARRPDGLYESYNVVHLDERRGKAGVERLHAMLEGQVAVLSAGVLGAKESLDVLEALFASDLYRADQRTFILAPRVDRPAFLDRNIIPPDAVKASGLLGRILRERERRIAVLDEDGNARFHPDLVTRAELDARLAMLGEDPAWAELVRDDAKGVREAYERAFGHARFTGRSGTMHKYEGIGSVYWHMVSKLLLAAQDCVIEAMDRGEDPELIERLVAAYRRVRTGLGMHKSPGEFGAVPHEPYSHTPWRGGAQQPGMTGQVKEGVLYRMGELGVRLRDGELRFDPVLLDGAELLTEASAWRVRGVLDQTIELPAGSLGFTVCATPVVLSAGERARTGVVLDDGTSIELDAFSLGSEWTAEILGRTGRIARIEIEAPSLDATHAASRSLTS